MATKIGDLVTVLSVRSRPFERGIKRAQKATRSLSRAMARVALSATKMGIALAAAAVAGAGVMIRSQLKAVDALAKTADKLGVTTEALAALQFQAKQAGVDTSKLNMALQRMTRRVSEAAVGTGEAQDAIKELGLNASEMIRMSPDKQLEKIADAMQSVENQADKVRLSFKLFDSEGVDLVNMLRDGSGAFEDARKEATAMGIAVDRVTAGRVEQANNAMQRFGETVRGGFVQVAAKIAPALETVANKWADWLQDTEKSKPVIEGVARFIVAALGNVVDVIRKLEMFVHGFRAAVLQVMSEIQSLANNPFIKYNPVTGLQAAVVRNLLPDADSLQQAAAESAEKLVRLDQSKSMKEQLMQQFNQLLAGNLPGPDIKPRITPDNGGGDLAAATPGNFRQAVASRTAIGGIGVTSRQRVSDDQAHALLNKIINRLMLPAVAA